MKFISPHKKLRLVMRPTTSFVVNGRREVNRGHSIEFKDGEYITENEEEIKFLMKKSEVDRKLFVEKTISVEERKRITEKLKGIQVQVLESGSPVQPAVEKLDIEKIKEDIRKELRGEEREIKAEVKPQETIGAPPLILKCAYCSFVAKTPTGLKIHTKTKHKNELKADSNTGVDKE